MERGEASKQGSMKGSESSLSQTSLFLKPRKPFFRPAIDDSKPSLQDPILRSDPIETEEAVLRLPVIRLDQHPQ